MEHVKVTDEWLYQYMPVVDAAIIQELEKQVNTEYQFSRKFKRKMRRLIRREAHPWIAVVENIMKRVAVFFIGVMSALWIAAMSVEACREKFFKTMKTFFADSVLYQYVSDEEEVSFQNSESNYIPDGYDERERIESAISLIIIYENNLGEQIVWEQKLVVDGGNMVLDSEYDSMETREIDGSTAFVYSYSDGYVMAYYEHEQYVYYITADRLESEEMFHIISSAVH
jgi:hypothetical protein